MPMIYLYETLYVQEEINNDIYMSHMSSTEACPKTWTCWTKFEELWNTSLLIYTVYPKNMSRILTLFTVISCPSHGASTAVTIGEIIADTTVQTWLVGTFINICVITETARRHKGNTYNHQFTLLHCFVQYRIYRKYNTKVLRIVVWTCWYIFF